MPFFRRVQDKERVYDHAMCIERAFVIRNRVGIAAMVYHVVYRDDVVSDYPPAFACLGDFDQIVLSLQFCFGLYESA